MSGSVLKTLSQLQSVPFNGSVNSDSLRPYCLQHIRLHCPSPTPRACLKFKPIKMVMPSNHLILCRPLLLWPSIFPCIRVFSNESVFASDGQSIGASASVIPMNIQIVPVVIRESSALYSLCQQIIAHRLLQRVLINHTELINKTIDIRRVFNW